jgi:hypothetical protein
MDRGTRHDPIALFAFALRERDWVLAELIARSLSRETGATKRLESTAADASAGGPSPASLRELRGWAAIARALGIGD